MKKIASIVLLAATAGFAGAALFNQFKADEKPLFSAAIKQPIQQFNY